MSQPITTQHFILNQLRTYKLLPKSIILLLLACLVWTDTFSCFSFYLSIETEIVEVIEFQENDCEEEEEIEEVKDRHLSEYNLSFYDLIEAKADKRLTNIRHDLNHSNILTPPPKQQELLA